MRVFLSWSGEASHGVACVLKEWLPSVIQSIRPYVSSQDIDKGARWSTDIAKELQESAFGILCVTRSNIEAPWINFEAGALSKTIDKGLVAPFLFDIKRSEVQGPLLQFQSTVNEQADVFKLIASLNNAMPESEKLEDSALKKSFDVWWPELEKALRAIGTTEERPKPVEKTGKLAHSEAILEEILDLTRSQQRLLRSPEELLPRAYFEHLTRSSERESARIGEALHMISRMQHEITRYVQRMEKIDFSDPVSASEASQRLLTELSVMVAKADLLITDVDRIQRPRRVHVIPRDLRRLEIAEKEREEVL